MNGTSKVIADTIDTGFTKIVDNIDMKKLLETLHIDQSVKEYDIFEFDHGNSIFNWNASNKERTIKELKELIKKDLKADFAYNIFSTMEMSLEEFFSEIASAAGITVSGVYNVQI